MYCYADILEAKSFSTVKKRAYRRQNKAMLVGSVEDFEKLTQSNIHYTFRTACIHKDVRKLRTEIKWLENSRELHKVGLHRKILKILKKITSWMDVSLSWRS